MAKVIVYDESTPTVCSPITCLKTTRCPYAYGNMMCASSAGSVQQPYA